MQQKNMKKRAVLSEFDGNELEITKEKRSKVPTKVQLKKKFINLSNGLIEILFNPDESLSSAAKGLIKINSRDFSEGDPLLLIVPIPGDPNSAAYINGGNYGIANGVPGHLPFPATGNIPGPSALGTFISQIQGVEDRSGGGLTLFKIPNLNTLSLISVALRSSDQFNRIGPINAQVESNFIYSVFSIEL